MTTMEELKYVHEGTEMEKAMETAGYTEHKDSGAGSAGG